MSLVIGRPIFVSTSKRSLYLSKKFVINEFLIIYL